MPASIKSVSYSTRVCVSTDGSVVYCECKCKIGAGHMSDDQGNILCVYICSSITTLTMILFDYLAEDVCYELASMPTRRGLSETLAESVKILACVVFSWKIKSFDQKLVSYWWEKFYQHISGLELNEQKYEPSLWYIFIGTHSVSKDVTAVEKGFDRIIVSSEEDLVQGKISFVFKPDYAK